KEIAGYKNISMTLYQLRGGSNAPKTKIQVGQSLQTTAQYEALIYDCGNDEKVKSDILEENHNLKMQGYSKILGIRDLFPLPLTDLAMLEMGLKFIPPQYQPLSIPYDIVVAVMEIEAWFLPECNHYNCIDSNLTTSLIATSNLGFNPCFDDVTQRNEPAKDLHKIYKLVGKAYKKRKKPVERTVDCLDYADMYINFQKLGELIKHIDDFLT
ncbi:MAG: hypothetical protein DRR08_31290, partial [Candidatus Parabeggiatoa sp. nov. 2]